MVDKPYARQEKNNPLKFLITSSWTIVVSAIALLIAIPILFIFQSILVDAGEIWQHLAETVLIDYLVNSFWLIFGVGFGVLVIGVGTAWLVTMCRFTGSRILEWALLLPLAAPAYVLAYTYTEVLDYYGVVQTWLRSIFGWTNANQYWFPDIRSLPGAIVMLILVLYPYVYLLARVAFIQQSVCTLEASRNLGCNPWSSFFKVALPLARPSIAAGLALALMETLNDLGTVEYFGVSTFTTGIYRTWLGMGERTAAAQLAACLMIFILVLIVLERWSRRQARYYQTSTNIKALSLYHLKGIRNLISALVCLIPVFFGFILPCAFLGKMSLENLDKTLNSEFWQLASHSFILASITALITVLISIIMAYGQRLQPNIGMRLAVRIAAMGYAIPGSVIAVGVMIPIGKLDNLINSLAQSLFNMSAGLFLSGTIVVLIYAYLVRFLAVGFGAIESSLNKISPNLDNAARSLGYGATSTLIKVHAPLIWGGMLTSAMVVFVDVMKELPATLVIRPFNFDTLAVKVYQYAADERLIEASAPALCIVLVGILPVILLSLEIRQSRPQKKQ
ncbi:MAG: iron ABC transporter permease [Cyanobacteria bacterium J083]|nr:MAG: iron ABC transporter permease [Cyanobacteria bacterium J083]